MEEWQHEIRADVAAGAEFDRRADEAYQRVSQQVEEWQLLNRQASAQRRKMANKWRRACEEGRIPEYAAGRLIALFEENADQYHRNAEGATEWIEGHEKSRHHEEAIATLFDAYRSLNWMTELLSHLDRDDCLGRVDKVRRKLKTTLDKLDITSAPLERWTEKEGEGE